jgi:hypothetical protein
MQHYLRTGFSYKSQMEMKKTDSQLAYEYSPAEDTNHGMRCQYDLG